MNNTLYTDLAPLGFAEWLEKNYDVTDDYPIIWADGLTINHLMRTVYNALAFRWLREEKDLDITVRAVYPFDYNDGYPKKVYVAFINKPTGDIYINIENGLAHNHFHTHELAEHHALNKALEIINNQNK